MRVLQSQDCFEWFSFCVLKKEGILIDFLSSIVNLLMMICIFENIILLDIFCKIEYNLIMNLKIIEI